MKCAEFDKKMASPPKDFPLEMIEHLRHCRRCEKKYALSTLLAQHSYVVDSNLVTGEQDFFERLDKLSTDQSDALLKANTLNESVIEGDRLFWRGDYDAALRHYNDALLLADDREGRAAILNKLARTQWHRNHLNEAFQKLNDALLLLNEPIPPRSFWALKFSLLKEQFRTWWLIFSLLIKRFFPDFFRTTIRYGIRSQSALHLYRELAILSKGYDETLSAWAHQRELYWALRRENPTELALTIGRHASLCLLQGQSLWAQLWANILHKIAQKEKGFAQATARFYLGRLDVLAGRWQKALPHLEAVEKFTQKAQDERLREANWQHLMRVYRKLGNYQKAAQLANQLLALYYKLGNIPRLSASCRYMATIYMDAGDLKKATLWAVKALDVAKTGLKLKEQSKEISLSIVRCHILLAKLEVQAGQPQRARHFLSEAIRLNRYHGFAAEYFADAIDLLRRIIEEIENFPSFQKISSRFPTSFQKELRISLPISKFARSFLHDEISLSQLIEKQDLDLITSMFSVGSISSRWGKRSTSSHRRTSSSFFDCAEAPWGYFFANDIG